LQRVANALKISLTTVKSVKSRAADNPVLSSPGRKRPRSKPKTKDLPEHSKMSIRDTIYKMYLESKYINVKYSHLY